MQANITIKDLQRFYKKVEFCDDGCWIWKGSKTSNKGNGQEPNGTFHLKTKDKNNKVSARRISCLIYFGELPHQVEVSCGNPLCVSPLHIILSKEEQSKIRSVYMTTGKPRNNFTDAKARKILKLAASGYTQPEIADKVGVGQPIVGYIIKMGKYCKEGKLKDNNTKATAV